MTSHAWTVHGAAAPPSPIDSGATDFFSKRATAVQNQQRIQGGSVHDLIVPVPSAASHHVASPWHFSIASDLEPVEEESD